MGSTPGIGRICADTVRLNWALRDPVCEPFKDELRLLWIVHILDKKSLYWVRQAFAIDWT
jgi:hypothetical protein